MIDHYECDDKYRLSNRYMEVPHECDDPKCPGNINRQKLEMFDEMLSTLRETRKAMQIAGGDLTCVRLDGIITRARALREASK